MGTIVQEYGPIYGEVVNGTVQGRPNGSVYVPISNSISIDIPVQRRYVKSIVDLNGKYNVVICNSSGNIDWNNQKAKIVAISQDLSNNVQLQFSDTADFSNIIGPYDVSGGRFNVETAFCTSLLDTDPIVNGSSYYVRAVLMANGTPVATSTSIGVVGYSDGE